MPERFEAKDVIPTEQTYPRHDQFERDPGGDVVPRGAEDRIGEPQQREEDSPFVRMSSDEAPTLVQPFSTQMREYLAERVEAVSQDDGERDTAMILRPFAQTARIPSFSQIEEDLADAPYEEALKTIIMRAYGEAVQDDAEATEVLNEIADNPEKQFEILTDLYKTHGDKIKWLCEFACKKFAEKIIDELAMFVKTAGSGMSDSELEHKAMTWIADSFPAVLEASPELLTILAEQMISVAGGSDVMLIYDLFRYDQMEKWQKALFLSKATYRMVVWVAVLIMLFGGSVAAWKTNVSAFKSNSGEAKAGARASLQTQKRKQAIAKKKTILSQKSAPPPKLELYPSNMQSFADALRHGLKIVTPNEGIIYHMRAMVQAVNPSFLSQGSPSRQQLEQLIRDFELEYQRTSNSSLSPWIKHCNANIDHTTNIADVELNERYSLKCGSKDMRQPVSEPKFVELFRKIGELVQSQLP